MTQHQLALPPAPEDVPPEARPAPLWRPYTGPLRASWRRTREVLSGARWRLLNVVARAQRAMHGRVPAPPGGAAPPLGWSVPGQRQANLQLYLAHDNLQRAALVRQPHPVWATGPAVSGLSVCILNLDKPQLIVPLMHHLQAVETPIFAGQGVPLEVLIGDTGSRHPDVLRLYARLPPGCRVQRGLRYHFAACNNTLARLTRYASVLFLNNDVLLGAAPGALWRMYQELHSAADVGVVGACLFFVDGRVQHMGVDFLREAPTAGLCYHPHARERRPGTAFAAAWDVPAVTGACLMIKRALFVEAGGMDEAFMAECQDIALCLTTARLGRRTRIVYAGDMVHLENATRPRGEENWADRQRFLRQWGTYIETHYL